MMDLAASGCGLDVGLGAVGSHDLVHRPVLVIGEQDALAEGLGGKLALGGLVGVPAGGKDLSDLGLHRGAWAAGPAAGKAGLQRAQPASGGGQGLLEPAGLRLMEAVGMGEDHAPIGAQRVGAGLEGGQAWEPLVVEGAVASAADG